MKQLIRLMGVLFVGSALTAAFAGTEMYSGKESKVVAPAPAPTLCDWTGFYIGLHAGGQFGHSETTDLDDWNTIAHHQFGYSESGFNGGAQFGYNFRWHWLELHDPVQGYWRRQWQRARCSDQRFRLGLDCRRWRRTND